MTQRYRNLIGQITADATMREAYRLTARGKRLTPGYLDFNEFSILNLAELAAELRAGSYVQGEPHAFWILDPKRRLISALPFRDRLAQQALSIVVGPLLDRAMLPRAFACRPGKGTHAAVVQLQSDLRRLQRIAPVYYLKTDFRAYFASIDRALLWQLVERHISLELPGQPERERIIARYLAPFGLPRRALKALGEGFETASPALMRQFCEHLKRMIVIGPRLRHDMRKESVFERLVTTIQPHPKLGKPPMWATADNDQARDRAIRAIPWPLPLVKDVGLEVDPAPATGDDGKVVQLGKRA